MIVQKLMVLRAPIFPKHGWTVTGCPVVGNVAFLDSFVLVGYHPPSLQSLHGDYTSTCVSLIYPLACPVLNWTLTFPQERALYPTKPKLIAPLCMPASRRRPAQLLFCSQNYVEQDESRTHFLFSCFRDQQTNRILWSEPICSRNAFRGSKRFSSAVLVGANALSGQTPSPLLRSFSQNRGGHSGDISTSETHQSKGPDKHRRRPPTDISSPVPPSLYLVHAKT